MIEDHSPSNLTLLELALRLRWSSAVARADSFPEEIAEQDEDGLTVLHWACCNSSPVWVFQAFFAHLGPFRKAACTKDRNNMTPLMCACVCRAPLIVISLFIEASPECVAITDDDGWTTFHFLTNSIRKEEHMVLQHVLSLSEQLLAVLPTLASTPDSHGRTPLMVLCEVYEVELHRSYSCGDDTVDDKMVFFWDLVCLLVDSIVPRDNSSSILHRLVCFPSCPLELVMFAAQKHPYLLMHQDSSGNSPLHLAIQRRVFPIEEFLARHEPKAASLQNKQDEFPFHVAIKSRAKWTEIQSILLESYPSVLETMDLEDTMFAEIFCRVQAGTVFQILRGHPTVIVSTGSGSSNVTM